MTIESMSTTIVVNDIAETAAFYETHLNARRTFDCGWYVALRFPESSAELCLMEPRDGAKPFAGGVTLNLRVADVDGLHDRLKATLPIAVPLEDHPWGDRGFGVVDPVGVMVYAYRDIPPSDEFKAFYLE